MTHAATLHLRNWGPYRGDHEVELGPGAFAVVAQRDGDPARSNAAGKTWFVGALAFALTGKAPENRLRSGEDGWITDEERDGYVELVIDDGYSFKRSRKRGKSTQVEVVPPQGGKAIRGEAQARIEELTGFGTDDLFAGPFVRQKQTARFVLSKPAERTKLVAGWLRLAPLQKAAEGAGQQLRRVLKRQEVLDSRIAEVEDQLSETGDSTDEEVQSYLTIVGQREALLDRLDDRIERCREQTRLSEDADRLRTVDEEESRLWEELAALDLADVKTLAAVESEAGKVLGVAEADASDAKKIAECGFDGTCPVTRGKCSVADEVRKKQQAVNRRFKAATKKSEAAGKKYRAARSATSEARSTNSARAQLQTNLRRIEEEKRRLETRIGHGPDDNPDDLGRLKRVRTTVERRLRDLQTFVAGAKAGQERRQDLQSRLLTLREEREALGDDVEVARAARAILGPDGAQRDVAEGSLGEIEEDANRLLAESGVGFEVMVRWGRETGQLATECQDCGSPFPKSARVKKCEACGANRGPKISPKLDVDVEPRSGATEDLAGLVVQVSAASWLRSERGARWGTLVVDEGTASLDEMHRGAAGRILAGVSSSLGFEQVFVVSHALDSVEAMPRRVEIEATDSGSRIARVV